MKPTKPSKETDVDRILSMLRALMRYTDLSHREVERRLGMSPNSGYLSRILNGSRELKVRQLLELLQVFVIPPGNFFRAAFPKAAESGHGMRLQQMLETLHPPPPPEPIHLTPEKRIEYEHLERLLQKTLEKWLSENIEDAKD